MRVLTRLTLLSAVLLAGWSFGQPPAADKAKAEKPSSPADRPVEELVKDVLSNHPDIQVAEMKVRLAEAELRRTRLTLAQKVLELRAVVDSHREVVKATQEEYEMYVALRRANSVPESDIRRLSAQLKKAKAELAQAEAGLNGLVGAIPGQPGLAPAGTSGPRTAGGTEPSVSRAPSGPTAQ